MFAAPPLRPAQADAWHALFDLHERLPDGWALVGGQMVQSLCWERGATPNRPTTDADTALDVRARPRMLLTFTRALRDMGFLPDGESFEGHQHRWIRGEAQIDVLIPRFLGERAERRRGATGGTTIAAPGTQGALRRAEPVTVEVNGRRGTVLRPTLKGALLSKAAAVEIVGADPTRHLMDIATLAALVTRRDRIADAITPTERRRVMAATAMLERSPSIARAARVDETAVKRLRLAMAGAPSEAGSGVRAR
ncbi:hypothetical protein DEJ28_07980 [Curtobacterium sp. MCPF17_002]|uniref:hypothetical protein n=1 Tax=Curtobacterium sp. MCPF17_002 TaxID=2175645 RepID=UPI0011B3BCCE|nr:hypothetical protein [Curtobacterium sp. MCPF17_002]WIB79026.1 hypothetical protein DEJ28_07980 [Curtobacterium sp. MCPF17_002]